MVLLFVLLQSLEWVDTAPFLFTKHSELVVANGTFSVGVEVPKQKCYVFEGEFKAEEVNRLCKLIQGDLLGMISVNISERLLEGFKSLSESV